MVIQQRRERERADRHRLIVATARDLAEAEGWDAVTTRKLAQLVEYSQPVLYSHFKDRDAIVAAVAIEGFAELTAQLHRARTAHEAPERALRAFAETYLEFARTRPALYNAMFVQPIGEAFDEAEPGFVELVAALEPLIGATDVETYAETVWCALHGMAALTKGDRLRAGYEEARLDRLLERFHV